ncbi:MAG: GntR family transcriptional regulator [Desulfomonile tiedjei]|nr:GntR family transcriptional regulator [Desulfomonile tiedjei]
MNKSVREKIYEHIRDEITYCRLNPGERLTESALAITFRASRSPIREALRQLETEGLLTFEPNKGFTVSKLSIQQVDEIYSIRWLLESYATRLTVENISQEQIEFLQEINEKCRVAANSMDLPGWLQHNSVFHNFFYDQCGNENLRMILRTLQRRIHRYKYIIVSVPGHFRTYLEEHQGILKACKRRDGEKAEYYMKVHLQTIREVLIGHLKRFHDTANSVAASVSAQPR